MQKTNLPEIQGRVSLLKGGNHGLLSGMRWDFNWSITKGMGLDTREKCAEPSYVVEAARNIVIRWNYIWYYINLTVDYWFIKSRAIDHFLCNQQNQLLVGLINDLPK